VNKNVPSEALLRLIATTSVAKAPAVAGALPVYEDLGGALLLRSDGSVVHVDDETGAMREVAQTERWYRLALVAATERFPELSVLRPERGLSDKGCESCGSTGSIRGVRCGVCLGLGWVTPPTLRGRRPVR